MIEILLDIVHALIRSSPIIKVESMHTATQCKGPQRHLVGEAEPHILARSLIARLIATSGADVEDGIESIQLDAKLFETSKVNGRFSLP